MAIDTSPSTVATSALQAIPFSSLIGGPLGAAIQAQAQAAQTSWEFIQNVGLVGPKGQQVAQNVTFQYNKNGQMTQLVVPLLTIVPIPYIAIDNVQIDFKANISASASSVTSTSDSSSTSAGGSVKASVDWGIFSASAEFSANYSSKKDSKASSESKYSVEYTMDVSVHAGQSDMPAGLAAVLNILQGSITDASNNGTFTLTPSTLQFDMSTISSGGAVSIPFTVVVKDNNGVLLANAPLSLALVGTSPSWLSLTGFPMSVSTDKNGQASFTIAGTANSTGYTPGTINLSLTGTASDKTPLTDSIPVSFINQFKSP